VVAVINRNPNLRSKIPTGTSCCKHRVRNLWTNRRSTYSIHQGDVQGDDDQEICIEDDHNDSVPIDDLVSTEDDALADDEEDNEVAAQPLDIPHPRFCLPPSEILHEQTKDDIVGKLLFAAQNDQLQSMTKEQFEDTLNLADNPRFQPYYKELKNFTINDKSLLCVKHPLLDVEGAGTRTKIVLPHWFAEVVACDVHKAEIHPGLCGAYKLHLLQLPKHHPIFKSMAYSCNCHQTFH